TTPSVPVGRQSFMAEPSSIAPAGLCMRLKTTGKGGNYQRDIARAIRLEPEIIEFAHPANFTAERAGGAVAALFAGTVLSRRPPRLGADGLALCDGSADVAAMDRSCRDVAVAAALGGCGRRREILPSPRHRFRGAARGDRRCRRWRDRSRRLDHHPANS